MRSLLLIVFIFLYAYAKAQNTDSLKQVLSTSKNDSSKIATLSALGSYYGWVMPDSALHFAQQELLLAKKRNWTTWQIDAMGILGDGMYITGNYSLALNYLLPVLQFAEKQHDTAKLIGVRFALSSIYRDIGDYTYALAYAFEAERVAQRAGRKNKVAEAMGIVGSIYEVANRLDSATFYSQRAYILDSTVNGAPNLTFVSYVLGNIYHKQHQDLRALMYYRKSVALDFARNNMKDFMDSYNGMATSFYNSQQTDSVEFYARQVLAVGKSIAYPLGVLQACKTLSGLYKNLHKADSVLKYNDLAASIQDSVFNKERVTQFQNVSFSEQLRRQDMEVAQRQYKNKVRVYILLAGIAVLLLFAALLYRSNRHKQKANQEINKAYQQLKTTQAQLIQSEKMASLGELTAGIAHEIQNPLNFVNNFSETNGELIDELQTELKTGNYDEAIAISNDLKENEQKIIHHGKRADSIVKSMLEHSRTTKGEKQPININGLVDEYLRLAYHGIRAKDKAFNVDIQTHFDENIGKVNIVPQEIGRVLLNLFNNAFYAVNEKRKSIGAGYEPAVTVSIKKLDEKIELTVQDNGMGISKSIVDKIFQPFFTTKPTGEGTGLGLSLSYDIIKAHAGELKVESTEGEGSEFTIILPL